MSKPMDLYEVRLIEDTGEYDGLILLTVINCPPYPNIGIGDEVNLNMLGSRPSTKRLVVTSIEHTCAIGVFGPISWTTKVYLTEDNA